MFGKKYEVSVPLRKGATRATPSRTVFASSAAEAISKAKTSVKSNPSWKDYVFGDAPKATRKYR